MGATAAVVSIVLIVGGGREFEAKARDAARSALSRSVVPSVAIEEQAAPLTGGDAALEEAADAKGTAAIAMVSWESADTALVRVFRRATHRWVRQSIRFQDQDESEQRGRTIGFAIASMMPDEYLRRPDVPETPAPETPALAAGPTAAQPAGSIPKASSPAPQLAPPIVTSTLPPAIDSASVPRNSQSALAAYRFAGSVFGRAVLGFGAAGAGGVGAGLKAGLRVYGPFELHGFAMVRFADQVGSVPSPTRLLGSGALLVLRPWFGPQKRWSVGASLGASFMIHTIGRPDPYAQPERQTAFGAAAQLSVEGGFRITSGLALVAAFGTELMPQPGAVLLNDQVTVQFPIARGFIDWGIAVLY
jgi:hypothetical protein